MLNIKICRKKLKETKIFFSPKKIPELILKEKNNKIGLTPKKIQKSMLLTESKTDETDLNNILTLRKLNIKKRLKPNKTEFISHHNINTQINNNRNNNMNKTFYKLNKPMNKTKSFNDISINLYKSKYCSHRVQTSVSFFKRNNLDKSYDLKNIKNLELTQSYKGNKNNNKITYIEYQINQILSKKKEKINKKSKNKDKIKIKNYKNIFGLINKINNNEKNNTFRNSIINNFKIKNDSNKDSQKEIRSKISKNKFHINKIFFEGELENLFHKTMIIQNNKNEFENFVMSLTNEELKLLYENKNMLPLLIKNRNNYNLTESNNFKIKEEKKLDKLKNIYFENNLINLFINGRKRPIIKSNFIKMDKNDSFSHNIDNYNQKYFSDTKNEFNKIEKIELLSKSQIYKKINVINKKTEINEEDLLKNEFMLGNKNQLKLLGNKNKLKSYKNNKEEKNIGQKMWERWLEDIISKKKDIINNDTSINIDSKDNNIIFRIKSKKKKKNLQRKSVDEVELK